VAFSPLTCITHQCISGFLGKGETILIDHTLNNGRRRMTQMMMPSCQSRLDNGHDSFIRRLVGHSSCKRKRVEAIPKSSSKKKIFLVLILQQKVPRMKFKKHIIVISEFMNRKKVFRRTWNMQYVFKDNITIMGANSSMTNMTYGHT
jgi:hypothetical protein